MSREDIIKELLQVISDSQECESMPYSTSTKLTGLVNALKCVE